MSTRCIRTIVALLAMAPLVAGPVAGCICVDVSMAEMPCCPDGSVGDESPMTDFDAQTANIACQLVPASPLPSSQKDLPEAPLVANLAYPDFVPRAPPKYSRPEYLGADTSPPIYLVTLRLRD